MRFKHRFINKVLTLKMTLLIQTNFAEVNKHDEKNLKLFFDLNLLELHRKSNHCRLQYVLEMEW